MSMRNCYGTLKKSSPIPIDHEAKTVEFDDEQRRLIERLD